MAQKDKSKGSPEKKAYGMETLVDKPGFISLVKDTQTPPLQNRAPESPSYLKAPSFQAALPEYIKSMKTRIPESRLAETRMLQEEWIQNARQRLSRLTRHNKGEDQLRDTGELPSSTVTDLLGGELHDLPLKSFIAARVERHHYTELLNHPAVLEAEIAQREKGFVAIEEKDINAFNRSIERAELNTFQDFALRARQPDPLKEMDERTLALHAGGLRSWGTTDLITSVTNGSSMHSVIGAESMATLASLGSMSFAPADARWREVSAALHMIERAREIVASDPLMEESELMKRTLSTGETARTYLINRANTLLGATIKPDPRSSSNAVKEFLENGVRLFRVYDAGSTNALYHTIFNLRQTFGDSYDGEKIHLIAGQVTGASQALLLEALGADAVIVGIGDGEMCLTSTKADISGDNVKVGYEIARSGIKIPLIFDGGVGSKVGVALAAGASVRLSSRGLIGGTIEQPPFQWFKTTKGNFAKLYSGEAGPATKILGNMVDPLGNPYNLEGINGYTLYNDEAPSIPRRIWSLNQALAKSLRFQRVQSVDELRLMKSPPVLHMSHNASLAAGAHHQH